MKILFIGSGCACRLPFAEHLFKKKLQEADVSGIEVETADMAVWGVTPKDDTPAENSGPEKVGNLLQDADFIVVMEGKQRNLLTRFLDYSSWNKIHLFLDYCKAKKEQWTGRAFGNFDYPTEDEEVNDGCMRLIDQIKAFLKEHLGEQPSTSNIVPA